MDGTTFEERISHMPGQAQIELYKLKAELLEQNMMEYKKRETYWMNQNQYLTESINAKLNGPSRATLFCSTAHLSPINLSQAWIKQTINQEITRETIISWQAICQTIYKSFLSTEEGMLPRVCLSNKNGTLKYILGGKIFCDTRMTYFISIIYEDLKTRVHELLSNNIENTIFLKTFLKLKSLKVNSTGFRKHITALIQDEID